MLQVHDSKTKCDVRCQTFKILFPVFRSLIWYRPMCVSGYVHTRADTCRRVSISSFIRELAKVLDYEILVSGFERWYSLPKDNAVQ